MAQAQKCGPNRTSSHSRRIAVHVDEPNLGHFFWVLMEREGANHWKEVDSADLSFGNRHDAMQAGMRALEGYAFDEGIGPRARSKDEDGNLSERRPPSGPLLETREQDRDYGQLVSGRGVAAQIQK